MAQNFLNFFQMTKHVLDFRIHGLEEDWTVFLHSLLQLLAPYPCANCLIFLLCDFHIHETHIDRLAEVS